VLEQLGRIRQMREEVAKSRFEAMEDAIESVVDSYDSLRFAVDRALEAESRYHQTVMQEAQLRYLMMVRLGVHPIIAQQRAWDWAWQQLRRRPVTMPATLENLQSLTSSLADQFEELGDAYRRYCRSKSSCRVGNATIRTIHDRGDADRRPDRATDAASSDIHAARL
jgi:hypothetical protein